MSGCHPENIKIGLGAWIEQLEKRIEALEKVFNVLTEDNKNFNGWCKDLESRIADAAQQIEELKKKINSDAKPRPKKQKFEIGERVICYSYDRYIGKVAEIENNKYYVLFSDGSFCWAHEKQLRRIKKK